MAKNDARRSALADAGITVLAREGSRGLTHRATGLAVAYALVLAVIVIRTRVRVSRAKQQRAAQSQREVSPAPTRTISG